jgi:myo-inositol-1(or 4)-monophosphatase
MVVIAPRVLRTRNIGSAALALAYVAAGRFDAMLHRFAHSWDYGAGALMVQEAGGVVTDMRGEAYTLRTHDVCATANGSLHTEFLSMLAESTRLRAS